MSAVQDESRSYQLYIATTVCLVPLILTTVGRIAGRLHHHGTLNLSDYSIALAAVGILEPLLFFAL
jgi:hypothetical protein